MIKVHKTLAPSILSANSAAWTSELCSKRKQYFIDYKAFQAGSIAKRPEKVNATSSRYAHQDILDELTAIFKGKCAYCESKIAHITYKAVDHFRPQSIYPKLAYDWENLLLSCPKCNSDYKKAKFPLPDGRQAEPDEINPCSLDGSLQSLLINPFNDEPDSHFDFSRDTPIAKTYEGAKTIAITRIDRDDLSDLRRAQLVKLEATIQIYLQAVKDNNVPTQLLAQNVIQGYTNSDAQFIAFTRSMLRKYGLLQNFPC